MVDNDVAEKEVFATLESKVELEIPKLPSWTDGPAITSYIVTTAGIVFGFLALMHIGFPASTPVLVQTWATIVGPVVAGVAQAINLITHRAAHANAYIAAQWRLRRLHSADGN